MEKFFGFSVLVFVKGAKEHFRVPVVFSNFGLLCTDFCEWDYQIIVSCGFTGQALLHCSLYSL